MLHRAGIEPWTKDIEIISTEPEIAVYVLGYTPGFASPGDTHYFILDSGGKFGEFAKSGRQQELASTDDFKLRHYKAYCGLVIKHTFGNYSLASRNDVDGCLWQ